MLGGETFEMGKSTTGSPNVKTYHLTHGNQDYHSTPNTADWPSGQVNEQIDFVKRLLGATSDPLAQQTLQGTLVGLQNRTQ